MDLATIIGLIVGTFFVAYGILTGEMVIDNLAAFFNPPSILIVGGGTLGAVMVSMPARRLINSVRVITRTFRYPRAAPIELINRMVQFAEIARRDGILALEGVTSDIQDEFLVKGIQLAVDGTDPELIEQIMSTELDNMTERHGGGRRVFEVATKYAPAWGMIGTLIGLILMLRKLDDPSSIGPNMAIALLTTFYGAVLANFIFGPMADKLALRTNEELLVKQIVVRGVLSIQSGDNPRIVEQRLRIFLPPKMRAVEGRQE